MRTPHALLPALFSVIASCTAFGATTTTPTIRLSPATAQLRTGNHETFTASTAGIVAPATVVWTVTSTKPGVTGDLGSVTSQGVYTAPAAVPAPNTVLLQAVDSADAKVFASSTVTILSPLPAITAVIPADVNTGLAYTAEIHGTNFLATSQVLFDGVPVPSALVAGALRVTGKSSAAAGTKITVTVANPGPAAVSGARTLTVLAPVQVTVTPDKATIRVSKTQQFYSRVLNNADTAVVWQVNDKSGGDATLGTITDKGMYTAPALLPAPTNVTIAAVSHADPTAKGSVTLNLENTVPAISSLSPSHINTGLEYTVDVNGTAFLSGSQVMFDGVAVPTKFVTGTKLQVAGLSTLAAGKTIAVTVVNPGPGAVSSARTLTVVPPVQVQVSPDKRTIRTSQTLQFTSHVVNNADQVVTWQVNGKTGGDTTIGTITDKGLYTAPAVLPAVNPVTPPVTPSTTPVLPSVTITAVSHADPTAKASVTLSLENAIPVITGVSPNPILAGNTTITIDGTGFASGAAVTFAGHKLNATFVSDKQLTVTAQLDVPVGRIAAVKVTNPSPGAATSTVVAVPVRLAAEQISYAEAVRFLEMASWGPTPGSVAHLQTIGRDAWIAEQLAMLPAAWPDPLDANEGVGRLQDAFFTNALGGGDQLRQRMAFALGHILVVSSEKDMHFAQMVSYQRVLGNDAFLDFRTLLGDMTLNPAMGYFLDMVNNDKANPVKNTVANENYAREVMQLFTVGLNRLDPVTGVATAAPEYDQSTVTEMAKVFTGWTYAAEPGFASHWNNPEYYFLPMAPFEAHHDTTQKNINLPIPCTIAAGGTAASDLSQALDCLANQANVAPFLAYRLIQEFVTSSPSTAFVGRVATAFNSSHGDLKTVITAILTDPETIAPGTVKLREPVLYATTLLRALNATVTGEATGVRGQTLAMGQDVLDAPSVFSYFSPFFKVAAPNFPVSGETTVQTAPEFQLLNAETAFGRINFAYRAAVNQISGNIKVDLAGLQDLASDPVTLAEAINQALYRGLMDSGEKTAVLAGINATADALTRVRNGVYVAAAAPQYQVEQ